MGARQSSSSSAPSSSSSSTAAIMTRIASLPHVIGFEPGSHARGTHDLDTPSYAALRYLRHACPSLDHVPTDLLLIVVQFTIGYRFLSRWQFNGSETDITYNGHATCVNLREPSVSLLHRRGGVPLSLPVGNGHAVVLQQPGTLNNVSIPTLKLWRSSFTISFWLWPNTRERHCVLADWSYPWSYIATIESDGRFIFQLRRDYDSHGSDPRQGLVDAGVAIPLRECSHVIVTWNRDTKALTLYLNGKQCHRVISIWNNTDWQQTDHVQNHIGWKQDDSLGFNGAMADLCVLAPFAFEDDDTSTTSSDTSNDQPAVSKSKVNWPAEPHNGERVRRPQALWLPGSMSTVLRDDDIDHYYQYCLATTPINFTGKGAAMTASVATPSSAPS